MGLHPSFKSILFPEKTENEKLRGKTIAIDSYIVLYKLLTTTVKENGDFYFVDGQNVSHIIGFSWSYEKFFSSLGINSIFVFDGKPVEEKYETLKERKSKKELALKQYKQASKEKNIKDMKKFSARTVKITPDIVSSFKDYISSLGYSYVDATHDAESLCAELVNTGLADYCLTQDTDTILYDCDYIVRNVKLSDIGSCDLVSTKRILDETNLTLNQLTYLAIITGTDYNEGIYGIGINKGMAYVKKANSIEDVVKNLVDANKIKKEDMPNFISKYNRTFNIFKELQNIKKEDIVCNKPNKEKRDLILRKIYSSN
jgi:flap endonuclease-1